LGEKIGSILDEFSAPDRRHCPAGWQTDGATLPLYFVDSGSPARVSGSGNRAAGRFEPGR
jgi:hypothetical protein